MEKKKLNPLIQRKTKSDTSF